MARIAPGLDNRDVHATASQVVDGELGEASAYATSLVVRIDADDVDDAHALVEGIQRDGNEPDRASVGDRDVGSRSSLVQIDRTVSAWPGRGARRRTRPEAVLISTTARPTRTHRKTNPHRHTHA